MDSHMQFYPKRHRKSRRSQISPRFLSERFPSDQVAFLWTCLRPLLQYKTDITTGFDHLFVLFVCSFFLETLVCVMFFRLLSSLTGWVFRSTPQERLRRFFAKFGPVRRFDPWNSWNVRTKAFQPRYSCLLLKSTWKESTRPSKWSWLPGLRVDLVRKIEEESLPLVWLQSCRISCIQAESSKLES